MRTRAVNHLDKAWPRDPVSATRNIRWENILLAIVITVGVAARLYEADYNLDGDEVFSVRRASAPFGEMISDSLQGDAHPPLHNVLLHLWIKVFGDSEISARSLSIVFSGFFLCVAYALLRRFVVTWLALGVLAILALSPFFVYYGQQARPYALIAFLSAVNLLVFLRVLDAPGEAKRLVVWAVSCALLLYAQYLAALLIAIEIAFALFCLKSQRLTILAYGSVGSALILPWLVPAVAAVASNIASGADPFAGVSWLGVPTPTNLAFFYLTIFGEPGLHVRWLVLVLALLAAGYARNLVTSRCLPAVPDAFMLLVSVAMPITFYVVSLWGPQSIFATRHLIGAALAFVVMIGLCLATLPRLVARTLLSILLAWTIASLPGWFPHNIKAPFREVASVLDSQYGATPVVVQEGAAARMLLYYRRVGSVRRWSELAEDERDERFLFVCRPARCSHLESEALRSRSVLLKTWRWGSKFRKKELRLFEIRSAT